MKFLFIYPSSQKWELATGKLIQIGGFSPPLGILYLARMLEDNGHNAEVLDGSIEELNKEKIHKYVCSSDAVGLTLYSEPREMIASISMARIIKEIDPNIPLVIGGPHCSISPEQTLIDYNADICISGYGEFVISSVANAIEGKMKLSTIPGITYRNGSKVEKGKPAEQIHDLDKVPFPARHYVNKYKYGYFLGQKITKGNFTSIISSRGCPNRCRFCQLPYFIPHYTTRSINNITDEIEEVVKNGYKTIQFVDDNFLANKKKAEKIMDYIIKKEMDIKIWIGSARVDSADKGLYQKMRDSGVESISFGIESGNQDVLDFYNKRITLDQIKKAVNLSNEMGFLVTSNFILGAPIETKKHIENTIKFAKSLPISIALFYNFGYLYGSSLWREAVENGKIQPDEFYVIADSNRGLGMFTEDELIEYTQTAYKSFYYNPLLWYREILNAFSKKDFRVLKLGLKIFL